MIKHIALQKCFTLSEFLVPALIGRLKGSMYTKTSLTISIKLYTIVNKIAVISFPSISSSIYMPLINFPLRVEPDTNEKSVVEVKLFEQINDDMVRSFEEVDQQ